MRLIRLSVHNLGVFRGTVDFDLAPLSSQDGRKRHLTVFLGHNGAGKSTLFQAFALALYGTQALGPRTSRQAYNDYLLSRLHRHTQDGKARTSQVGGVTLVFEYIQSGIPLLTEVQRVWRRRGKQIKETLLVFQNNSPPDVPQQDYQIWLNEFVPPSVIPLLLFDAEQLNVFADPDEHRERLSEVLERLLGLDLVERLVEDLDYYTVRQGTSQKVERVRTDLLEQQARLDGLTRQQNQLQMQEENLALQESDLTTALGKQEQHLVSMGGTYAEQRPQSQQRLVEIQKEIEQHSALLHKLSAELLPFALAPALCNKLSLRLMQEAEWQEQEAGQRILKESISSVEATLRGDALWQDLDISPTARQSLEMRLLETLYVTYSQVPQSQAITHHLSRLERREMQQWISEAAHRVPHQAQVLATTLQELKTERKRIERDLKRTPENELLAPIHREILKLEAEMRQVQGKRSKLVGQISILQFKREELARQCERILEQLYAIQDQRREVELAERSTAVLKTYQDALTRQRLDALESSLVTTFNAICQKEHLVHTVQIDPGDFRVQLRQVDGFPLSIADLSAGERQLYALALLWALRRVSGRQLPVAVDTPLARLDGIHRWRLMHDYIPVVSDQVILFVTDAELDADLLDEAEPYLARTYSLDYDAQQQTTVVQSNQGTDVEDITLYRVQMYGPMCTDASDNDGWFWTTDRKLVAPGHKAERALLPAAARRLVLVDSNSGHSELIRVADLEHIVQDQSLIDQVESGIPIYELWKNDWTSLVRQAGYDSIATACKEGLVEYVLDPSKLVSSQDNSDQEE